MNRIGSMLASLLLLTSVGCSDKGPSNTPGTGTGGTAPGTGGSPNTGGASTGGNAASGGSITGGTSTGGTVSSGGGSTGGVVATGGAESAGGTDGSGGDAATGGGGNADVVVIPDFDEWPSGKDPATVGKKVAQRFVNVNANSRHYALACDWYGALQIARLTEDGALLDSLIGKYGPYLGKPTDGFYSSDWPTPGAEGHVDANVWGIIPFEIYLNNDSDAHLQDGLVLAENQIQNQNAQLRYAIDDMFMAPALQMQAYRATGDVKYMNFAAEAMADYLDQMQQADGLFFQLQNVTKGKWGRGNGWFAAGMVEVLQDLPKDHKDYARILEGYEFMMSSLLSFQQDSGLWMQVIDHPTVAGNWEETSGTAMFTFAYVVGLKLGLLDVEEYGPAARKAWLALTDNVTADGKLDNVVGACYANECSDCLSYYFGRDKGTDQHGPGPLQWVAAALLKDIKKK